MKHLFKKAKREVRKIWKKMNHSPLSQTTHMGQF